MLSGFKLIDTENISLRSHSSVFRHLSATIYKNQGWQMAIFFFSVFNGKT
jgi:hypothetical protein